MSNPNNHYVNSLETFPEEDTPVKEEDDDSCHDEEDATPQELKEMFFSMISELQRQFPSYTPTDFRNFLETDQEMKEQLAILRDNFVNAFLHVPRDNPEYINMLIGMSNIGIQFIKDEENEEDEGDDG